jgi:hypothetical protein
MMRRKGSWKISPCSSVSATFQLESKAVLADECA